MKDHDGVYDNRYSKKRNCQPCQLGSFILSHSKRLMNNVIFSLDGFKDKKNTIQTPIQNEYTKKTTNS